MELMALKSNVDKRYVGVKEKIDALSKKIAFQHNIISKYERDLKNVTSLYEFVLVKNLCS